MKDFFDIPELTMAELAEVKDFAELMAEIERRKEGREFRPPTAYVIPLPDEDDPPAAPRRPSRIISLAE